MILNLLYKLYKSKSRLKMTRGKIEQYQKKKLDKILLYAYDHSDYYKTAFTLKGIKRSDIGKIDITNYPTLDKKTLMENFNNLVCKKLDLDEMRTFDADIANKNKLYKDKYHIVHSSGTTEKPGYFVYDESAWSDMLVGIVRAALWGMSMKDIVKLLIKKPKIVYIAATDGRYGGAMAVGDGITDVGAEQLFLDIKEPLEDWIDKLNKFNPNIVIGYPSAIKILGESIARNEIDLTLERIITCGEPLPKNLRDYFENEFNCDVINFYGASESLALGVEVGNKDEMYLFDDMNYIEIIDDSMYITCLYNYIQPLIRYKITDNLTENGISNIIPFKTVTNILGRNEDLMWFRSDKGKREFLHPLCIEGFCLEGMLDYQFKKLNDSAFEMIVELSDESKKKSIEKEMKKQMKDILKEKKLEFVKFSVRFVEDILPDPKTGKKRLIVN